MHNSRHCILCEQRWMDTLFIRHLLPATVVSNADPRISHNIRRIEHNPALSYPGDNSSWTVEKHVREYQNPI